MLRVGRRLRSLVDPAIAAAVLLLSLLPLLNTGGCECEPAPMWAYALVVAQCLPLVWRRRWPFTVGLVCGCLAVGYGVSSLPDPPVSYAPLVAVFSAAAYASRGLAYAAGGLTGLGIAVALLLDLRHADLQDVLVNYLVFATAWLLGDSARSRRAQAAQLEERAAAAERSRAAEAGRAVVEERNRIARELHDVVAHHVSLMVVQAEAGPVVVDKDPARAAAVFDSISGTGKQALTEMRRLLGVLREGERAERQPQPGADAIPRLVNQVRAVGVPVTLEVTGAARPLPPAVDLSAYRLVQEALTNVSRHAGPARALVSLDYRVDRLGVSVVDDGTGSATDAADAATDGQSLGGHGLVAMRERVALLGGSLEVGPRPGGGWVVSADLPLAGAGLGEREHR